MVVIVHPLLTLVGPDEGAAGKTSTDAPIEFEGDIYPEPIAFVACT